MPQRSRAAPSTEPTVGSSNDPPTTPQKKRNLLETLQRSKKQAISPSPEKEPVKIPIKIMKQMAGDICLCITVFGNTFDVSRQLNVISIPIPAVPIVIFDAPVVHDPDAEENVTTSYEDIQITGMHQRFVLHYN